MILTKRQEGILKGLLNDDDWVDLLKQIEADYEIKAWKPGKSVSEDHKNAQWIYDSGKQRSVSDILTTFRLTT